MQRVPPVLGLLSEAMVEPMTEGVQIFTSGDGNEDKRLRLIS